MPTTFWQNCLALAKVDKSKSDERIRIQLEAMHVKVSEVLGCLYELGFENITHYIPKHGTFGNIKIILDDHESIEIVVYLSEWSESSFALDSHSGRLDPHYKTLPALLKAIKEDAVILAIKLFFGFDGFDGFDFF